MFCHMELRLRTKQCVYSVSAQNVETVPYRIYFSIVMNIYKGSVKWLSLVLTSCGILKHLGYERLIVKGLIYEIITMDRSFEIGVPEP